MKHNFSFFCKSYINDIKRIEMLINSYNKHNIENIHLYLSVPTKDLKSFTKFNSTNITVLSDEDYALKYLTNESYNKFKSGYINQEICKLAFWETGVCENYLCIDSDVFFIRDFKFSDFMFDKNTPYTVLVMDKDLSVENYYKNFWEQRYENIKKIYEIVGLEDNRYRSNHGMTILNAKVLKSLKFDFMQSKGYSYKDLILIAPYEFTWYNAWMQKCNLIQEKAVEPFFKTFHCKIEYTLSRFKNIKLEDYAKSYVGVVLNSNWVKNFYTYKNPNLLHKFIYFILKKIL